MSGQFFHVVVDDLTREPSLTGICAGYEGGEWRLAQLVKLVFRALPEFCLRYSELQGLNGDNAMELIATAAKRVYQTEKFRSRGEFGELFLHVVLKELFSTLPAISKIFFKDSVNNTVKGFDAVHVIPTETGLQLWLGEVKFYESISSAITDVCEELDQHFKREYLRNEFILIDSKVDTSWPHADKLRQLIHESTSLDDVFESIVVPVLLTYDSPTTKAHLKRTQEYVSALTSELERHYQNFDSKNPLTDVTIRLILFPLKEKKLLVKAMDTHLKRLQCL